MACRFGFAQLLVAGALFFSAIAGAGANALPQLDTSKSHVLPGYPAAAKREGRSGSVVLAVHVNELGKPYDVRVDKSSGSSDIDEAAVFAVRYWRFVPAERDGDTIAEWTAVGFRFDAEGVHAIEVSPDTDISRAERNKRICRQLPPITGSIVNDKPVCMAKWEWDEQARRTSAKRFKMPTAPAMGGAKGSGQ